MALSFENTFSETDFMPSIDEMKKYKLKLDNTEIGKGDIRVEKIADVFSSPSILKSRKDN